MAHERKIGVTENVPAGDQETAKHPANDPVVGVTGNEEVNVPRDREARLAQDAGARPRARGADGERQDHSYLQQDSDAE